jgi:hypothetical protein
MRLSIAAVLLTTPLLVACTTRDDDYLLLRRVEAGDARAPTRLVPAKPNDSEALYLRQLLANGFGAELLRTYAMTKRFAARTTGYQDMPTTIVLGRYDGSPVDPRPRRQIDIGWWRTTMRQEQPVTWIDDSLPPNGPITMAQLVAELADDIVDVVAPEAGQIHGDAPSAALRWGYRAFLEVVAAEWRTPSVTDDRDDLRKMRTFADIRANEGVRRARGKAGAMIGDPDVVATVLYRLASSGLGQRMADPAVYLPFLQTRPPRGVHPALLLGAFRNFQAKLLAAWSRARTAGRAPHDLIDLIEAYGDAYPAERAEAMRIFLVTTYGATAVPDGIRADEPSGAVESKLALLTADVLFGRRGLRDGFAGR